MRPLRAAAHYFRNTDLYLLLLALTCSAYSLILVRSATASTGTDRYVMIQAVATGIGVIAFIVMSLIDLENIKRYWKPMLLINVVVQLSLRFIGSEQGGNRSWIDLAPLPISIQPGEVGKIVFIITLAAHLVSVREELNRWPVLIGLCCHAGILFCSIVVAQHDAGVALSYLFILLVMLFAAGLSYKWIFGGVVLALASVPFIWQVLSSSNSNRLSRILVLFDPAIDADTYYQTLQSKIAIGSGQLYGSGYMQGLQTQYNYLPAKRTDFIFSVAAEEFGFIGAMLILCLLTLVILRLFYDSYRAGSMFSACLTVGIAGMFLFQTFENILMCLGMFPIVGLTLPLFSYGGSSVVTMYAALGVAAGVRMREKPSWLQR